MEPLAAGGRDDETAASQDAPALRRRYSMEEDLFYRCIMTAPQRRLSRPPPYQPGSLASKTQDEEPRDASTVQDAGELLPGYQSNLCIEGVFSKKHEIEHTTKRAEDRQWHTVFVTLNGTALNVYSVKKDWGWGKTRDGPTISPDNPPWVRKSRLEKSYSLLHADAGIAADYTKRRYVIRVRAETDQFLLSCIELSTFVKWLECLFAGIDVAAPINDRDFPRDMSIPRVQRIRWFQGQSPALPGFAASSALDEPAAEEDAARPAGSWDAPGRVWGEEVSRGQAQCGLRATNVVTSQRQGQGQAGGAPTRMEPPRRLSTTNYPSPWVDPHTGKWFPENQWSSAHDLLYAKLCYSNLLFRSPRKSNYIISKGKQWFVDWRTGRMVRVLPPTYGEVDYFGPWQVIHTENLRI